MEIRLAFFLLLPALLRAQALAPSVPQQPTEKYYDSIFRPGAREGSPPLSVRQKFDIHAYRMIAPHVFIGDIFYAGLEEAKNTPGAWGRGFDGYAKRYGTNLGVNAMREAIAGSIDIVTHEDPRFYRSDSTRFGTRLRSALLQVIVTHTDSGGRNLAYGTVLSAYGSAQLAALWLPHRQSTVGDALFYGTALLGGDAARNVVHEFWPDVRRRMRHK